MARLPVPGSDDNAWGDILNTFLGVAHNSDGTLQNSALTAAGGVATVNGHSPVSGSVTLNAADVGALTQSAADTRYASATQEATLTTLGLLREPHVNLLHFAPGGPDGTTNNSAAFLSAIQAAAAGPRILYVPRMSASWIIGTPVVFPAGADIVIFGDGWGGGLTTPTIQLKAGLNDFGFKLDTTGTQGNRVTVRDLEIDGNCSQQTGGGCFLAYNAVQCLFDAVHFHHAYDVALHFYGQQGSGPFGHHNRVVNSLFDNSASSAGNGNAIRIQATDECIITNCDFESNGGSGGERYHIKDWSGLNTIANNVFVGGGECVRFQNVSGSRFIGNMIDGVADDAVHISGSKCVIANNYFSGISGSAATNTYRHVYMDNGGSNTITGNIFDSGTVAQGLRAFISHQTSSTNDMVSTNVFNVNASLGDGGVFDWNGGSATAQTCIVKTNIGLSDQ